MNAQCTTSPAQWAASATDDELAAVIGSRRPANPLYTTNPEILAAIDAHRAMVDAATDEAQSRDVAAGRVRAGWYDPVAWAMTPGRSYRASDRSDG